MERLPEKFIYRMKMLLGQESEEFFACYGKPPVRGLRVNTLKVSAEELLEIAPWGLAPSEIIPEGFVLTEEVESIGNHPYHMAGLFYMQEPSAMSPIDALDLRPGMRVLDVCAAPGGKSGGIAARLKGEGLLVSNEVVPGRAKTLSHTVERLGVVNSAVTCSRPNDIAAALPEFFDRVMVDAPCSGEGMFRKDPGAIGEWSEEHVATCAARQLGILRDACDALAPGGVLVYSTCTFSPEENEGVVESLLRERQDMALERTCRLYPHTCKGEGHFVAKFSKDGAGQSPQPAMKLSPCRDRAYREFIEDTYVESPPGEAYALKDGRVLLLRDELPEGLSRLRMLCAGICAGEMKNGRFQPGHGLFMSAEPGKFRNCVELDVDGREIWEYFRGNTLPVPDRMRGWCAVMVKGHCVGFGKAVDGVMKNHLPKGLRIM